MKIADAYFDGGFGQKIPRLQGGPAPDTTSAETITRGAAVLANAVGDIGFQGLQEQSHEQLRLAVEAKQERERIAREQEMELKRLAREKEKSGAMSALVAHENNLTDIVSKIKNDPAIPTEKYQEVFDKQAEKEKADFLGNIPEEYQYAFTPTFEGHIFNARGELNKVVAQETRDKAKANLSGFVEELERSPKSRGEKLQILDEALADDATWKAAGLGPDDKVKVRQNFAEKTAENEIALALNTGSARKVMEALHSQGKDGSFVHYPELDPKTRESYFHTAKSRWEQEQAEAERQRNEANRARREAARDAYEVYKEAKEGLYPISVQEEAKLLRQLQGTPYFDRAKSVQRKTTSIGFELGKIKEDPLVFGAAKLGLSVPPLDPRNPGAWPQQITDRAKVGAELQKKYGLSYVPVLTNQEAQGLAGLFAEQSPQGLTQTVSQLQSLPGMKGGTLKRIASQIAAADPSTGMVIGLAANGQQQAAFHVANGQKMLKDKDVKLPKSTTDNLTARFSNLAGDAISHLPQTRSQLSSAVGSAYVSMASQKGVAVDDFDKRIYEEAFHSVVGETVKLNGKHVVIPQGMGEGQFKDFFKSIDADTVKRGGGVRGYKTPEVAASYIKSAGRLWEMGDGKYKVSVDGRFLATEKGQDFILSIGEHY